jgi:hypothetical protein
LTTDLNCSLTLRALKEWLKGSPSHRRLAMVVRDIPSVARRLACSIGSAPQNSLP